MSQNKSQIKYFIYARKSTEGEDRQVQSIEDQINRLKELARTYNLKIIKIFTEAKSAKKPNIRPIFEDVLKRIENGEADGIMCWQINRLSRNPIDSAKVQWLLQQGVLKSIQTIDREYLPDDNVLLFNVESGMANQYILDLRKNTMRGVRSRLEKGWLPNTAPLGYLNNREDKTIIKDPERFALVRKIWDLMLTGNYAPSKILEMANNDWGFKTRKCKRQGGKELSRSGIYRILTNPFYVGILNYNGREYEGKHEPMVTFDEYDRVQILLGRKGRPRPKTHEFAFTGMIRCGECGCLYTAGHKHKLIKSTNQIKDYTYYFCTRKKKTINCSQRKAIREEELEKQIDELLKKYTILPQFKDWALEVLNQNNDKEINDRSSIYETQHKTLVTTQNELDNLTKMRYRDLIDDETFMKEKNLLVKKITQLKDNLRQTEERAEKWLELTENTFNFACYARANFMDGDLQTKKGILAALGWNPTIKDGKLSINAYNWLVPIAERYPALEKEYQRLEPTKTLANKAQNEALASIRTRWLRDRDLHPGLEVMGLTRCYFSIPRYDLQLTTNDRQLTTNNK